MLGGIGGVPYLITIDEQLQQNWATHPNFPEVSHFLKLIYQKQGLTHANDCQTTDLRGYQ